MKTATELSPTLSINEITARFPDTIEVFNRFGVDACCGGDATVAAAATRDGVDLAALKAALQATVERSPSGR